MHWRERRIRKQRAKLLLDNARTLLYLLDHYLNELAIEHFGPDVLYHLDRNLTREDLWERLTNSQQLANPDEVE